MNIEKISGLDKHLFELVAPLVMNPRVIRQNMNYPFKTSKNHIWFVALENKTVAGFLPVEIKDTNAIINNYYVSGEDLNILSDLIVRAETEVNHSRKYRLVSVTQTRHIEAFEKNGFSTIRTWKNFVKMEKADDSEKECI